MKVLVTGGAGFIGSAIVDALAARGDDVVVVDRLHPGAHQGPPTDLTPGVEYRFDDLSDLEVASRAVAGVDAVCHQASMVGLGVDFADAPAYVADNDLATAQLLRALHDRRFAGRIVLASSMVIYGEGRYRCDQHGVVRPGPRSVERLEAGDFEVRCPTCDGVLQPEAVPEDAPSDPRNVYAATKAHQEHLCSAFAREHTASVVALRYHNVYGPRMPAHTPYAGVASIFRSAVERGEAPLVFEDGGQTRDFVHVRDVAAANLAALALPTTDGCAFAAFNVASGTPRTVLDAATAISAASVGAAPPQVVGGYRLGDVRHVFASTRLATAQLGFTAEVDFATGMAEFARAPMRPTT